MTLKAAWPPASRLAILSLLVLLTLSLAAASVLASLPSEPEASPLRAGEGPGENSPPRVGEGPGERSQLLLPLVMRAYDASLPLLSFSQAVYTSTEGAGALPLTVTLSFASAFTVTVDYFTSGGTAQAGEDYLLAGSELVFPPGQATSVLTLTILDDELVEPDVSVYLALGQPLSANLSSPCAATVTILEDDEWPELNFERASYWWGESAGQAEAAVALDRRYPLTVTVNYSSFSLSSGQNFASAGQDYIPVSGTLTFAPGQLARTVSVTLVGDELVEMDEAFGLALTGPVSNAVLGEPATTMVAIVDDDEWPRVSFDSASSIWGEGVGDVPLGVSLDRPYPLAVSVAYTVQGGTAAAGEDYALASGELAFPPGHMQSVLTLTLVSDGLIEPDETAVLALVEPLINAVLGEPATTTLTILDYEASIAVRFSSSHYQVAEGAGQALVWVALGKALTETAAVDYELVAGSAQPGRDYVPLSGTLSFSPGQVLRSLSISLLDDALHEHPETLNLVLTRPVNTLLAWPYTATLTILDDDPPPGVGFGQVAYGVGEAEGLAAVTVTLDAPSDVTVTLDYAAGNQQQAGDHPASGPAAASAGIDYLPVSGTLRFSPGQTLDTFSVPIISDGLAELDETLVLTLANPLDAVLRANPPGSLPMPWLSATLTILDDDPLPAVQFERTAYSVGESAGPALVSATLSHGSWQTVTVDYVTGDDTAKGGADYVAASGRLIFPPWPAPLVQPLQLIILDDALDEPDETLTLTLSNPSGAVLGVSKAARLTILDDDSPPVVQFYASSASISEAAGRVPVTVSLSAPSGRTVTVRYVVEAPATGHAATGGEDYTPTSGTLSFSPGQVSRALMLTIVNDKDYELAETLVLSLTSSTNATIGARRSLSLSIVDNDSPPLARFGQHGYVTPEEAGSVSVTVTLSAKSWQTITVGYTTEDWTAVASRDYLTGSGVLTFAPGQTARTFSVFILGDSLDEANERLRLRLANPVNASLGVPNPAALTILGTLASRFSLQIAALHEIKASAVMAEETAFSEALTEADWLELEGTAYLTLTEALMDSGAGWTRVFVTWPELEPTAPITGQPPSYSAKWWSWFDYRLGMLAETGTWIIATVSRSPDWAAEVPCGPIYPDRLDEYARFLTDLVNHYKQPPYTIKYWEVVNEPDWVYPNASSGGIGCWGYYGAEYAQALEVAYTAIKAADPEATVLMGGVAHDWFLEYDGPFNRYFPDDVMANGGGAFADALNFHYFPDFHAEWERWDPRSADRRNGWLPAPTCGDVLDGQGTPYEAGGLDLMAKFSHFRNRMRTCFGVDKPVWVTELAEHGYANLPDSLARQARYVIQGHVRGLAAGAENITWYALTTPNDYHQQGLLFTDWSPKPSFYAYQALTAELAGYEYARERGVWAYDSSTLGFSYSVEAYVFANAAGHEKTVAWGSGQLDFSSAQVRVVDRWGNVSFVADGGAGDVDGAQNGAVTLQLSADPVFVSE
ncbi:MAG: hypothetical protein JW850_10350 [Thermoflexales bacterium]|nr:hypothetical protein [Thermoflexales bacterium]